MHIAVIGTGYVGLVTGVCLARAGHQVTCVDIDEAKVRRMLRGEVPIYEPGLAEMFAEVLADGHLVVTTSLEQGVTGAEVVFLALPTPPGKGGAADLSAVLGVAEQLGPLLRQYTVIVDKSTVPVGTGEQVAERIAAGQGRAPQANAGMAGVEFDVVSNPEFLREGKAVQDFMHPDRIVIGASGQRARQVMARVYESFVERPEQLVYMDIRSAELTKYAANSFLAMKVSFMNEVANLAEHLGADVESVRLGIGPDSRIGRQFLQAGIGFGGSCFPKDVLALHTTSTSVGYDFKLLDSILQVNALQKKRLVEKVLAHYGGTVAGKQFGLWGLAFKPDTDDIREAPALDIIDSLLAAGATVRAYDPQATANVRKHYTSAGQASAAGAAEGAAAEALSFADTALAAADGADALLIATEWDEFRGADLPGLKAALAQPVIFDGRNLFEPADMAAAGFTYSAIGRPS